MSCLHPLLAVDYGKQNGKRKVQVLTRIDAFSNIHEAKKRFSIPGKAELIMLPCGKCSACIRRRRSLWAVRCEVEAKYHQDSCFVTLTYNEKNYPKKDLKEDYQDFIKALRNRHFKVRYFGCCEAGERGRYHYHIILFGFKPDDLKFITKTDSGVHSYSSKLISDIWNKGFVMVEDFSPAAAAYVAGYVEKKLGDKDSFIFMSSRPGIGRAYAEDHQTEIIENDGFVSKNGKKVSMPRYFQQVYENKGISLESAKKKRVQKATFLQDEKMRQLGHYSLEENFEYQAMLEREYARSRKRIL